MSHAKSPAACAEFPNDNRALHRGSIWTCADPCEPATVDPPVGWRAAAADGLTEEAGEFAGVDEAWPDDIEIVDELSFEGEVFEEVPAFAPSSAPPPPIPTLAEAAPPAAFPTTQAPPPPNDVPVPSDPYAVFTDRVAEVARAAGGDTAASAARVLLDSTEIAWRGILRGESDDFSACGNTTLDEWSAELVARVLGQPSRAPGLKQELRRRGVAAFGLLDDAV